jgi:hypothetical protein
MKNKETLEEAAENAFNDFKSKNLIVPQKHILPFKLGYIEGAKWQTENKYSEEDLMEAYMEGGDDESIYKTFYQWFENFKNK